MTDWTFKISIEYLGEKYTVEIRNGANTQEAIEAIEKCINLWSAPMKMKVVED